MSKALIVSQYVESRLPLLQIASRCPAFRDVVSVHNLGEAQSSIQQDTKTDFVFVTNTFSQEELAKFIEKVKRTPGLGECAFILVLGSEAPDSGTVAQHMFLGVHGFLCEPLSLEGLEQATKLAKAVKLQESTARLRAATGLMLCDVMEENDPQKNSTKNLWDRVQDGCRSFKELTGESVSVSVVKELKETPSSQRAPSYNGVSSRVRSVFERKFREHIERLKRNKAK